jgi:hypothetical protein
MCGLKVEFLMRNLVVAPKNVKKGKWDIMDQGRVNLKMKFVRIVENMIYVAC